MTYSRRNSLGRGGLKLAILLALATASFASPVATVAPVPSLSECPLLGTMTVIAPRLPPRAVVVADLGAMTVGATRAIAVADLGAMTVSAPREVVVSFNLQRATQRAF